MPLSAAPLGPVRILLIEDSPEDAERISLQLIEAGLEAECVRVDSELDMREALNAGEFDLVLSDLDLPGFPGHRALTLLREIDPVLPFIFVSGTIGEETAVLALQQGANDYVLKHNTARLPAAAARAIREARNERECERAEKELMRSQRLSSLAMLAAGLSHDLRNILQPMLIVPDLLARYSDDPKILRLGALVAESGRRGHEMAELMLSFVRGSRKESGLIKIRALFQAVQLLLQGSLPKSMELDVRIPPESLSVEGNYTELQQCLINLCLNGIQAMENSGGTLSISAEAVGDDQVILRVCDEGCGMNAQTIAQLFTPFFTTKRGGTGLGLMSCRRIIDGMQGRIDVESEPGRGTVFTLTLPTRLHAPGVLAEEGFQDGQGQRILVVDGDATRLSLLVTALSSQGYVPIAASDGAAALRQREEAQPDLVIVDSDILLLSAVSLLLALRDGGFEGPVITLEDANNALNHDDLPAGTVSAVVHKPLKMGAILRAVERTLARVQTPALE